MQNGPSLPSSSGNVNSDVPNLPSPPPKSKSRGKCRQLAHKWYHQQQLNFTSTTTNTPPTHEDADFGWDQRPMGACNSEAAILTPSTLLTLIMKKGTVWKMFCLWISMQIFARTIIIIEYPMIRFLAMCYFFVHTLNAQWLSKLSVAMHYWYLNSHPWISLVINAYALAIFAYTKTHLVVYSIITHECLCPYWSHCLSTNHQWLCPHWSHCLLNIPHYIYSYCFHKCSYCSYCICTNCFFNVPFSILFYCLTFCCTLLLLMQQQLLLPICWYSILQSFITNHVSSSPSSN